jgi:hypothetical protein
MRARTKKHEAEVNRSRRAFDKNHSLDRLHELALAEFVDRDHTRWLDAVDSVRRTMNHAAAQVAEFSDDFLKNPYHAFRWADGAMAAAARMSVLRMFVDVLEARGPEHAYRVATEEALMGARNPAQSTSPCANAMADYTTAAWADVVDRRSWMF